MKNRKRAMIGALVALAGAAGLAVAGNAGNRAVPGLLDCTSSSIAASSAAELFVPALDGSELVLSRLRTTGPAPVVEEKTTVARSVSTIADFNPLSGQYLFQTHDSSSLEGSEGIVTWLGDSSGRAAPLYRGAGYAQLSPNGKCIAVVDDRDMLKIVRSDGAALASFGQGAGAIFSSDGSKIAYLRAAPDGAGENHGIEVDDLRSGEMIARYNPNGDEYYPLVFSADGKTLFFVANRFKPTERSDPHNLNRVNVLALSLERPGASPRLVTAGDTRLPFIAYARALYLPSGLLALSAGNALWVVNSQSGKTASIANRDAPVWTGAGDTLLVRDTANAASSWQLLNAATLNGL